MKIAVIGRVSVSFGPTVEIIPFKKDTLADSYLVGVGEPIEEVLLSLRQAKETALAPVYLAEKVEEGPLLEVSDGIWQEEKSLQEIEAIRECLSRLSPLSPHLSESERRLLFFLRFLWSRRREEVRAYPEVSSRVGYYYPLLRAFLGVLPGEEIEFLEQLAILGLLRPANLLNRVPLCPHDGHYQLIFRESCPQCGSLSLQETELYYHFDCGYVGPREDFRQEEGLRCPKCQRYLRHLGEDYEIPNRVFRCLECGYLAEEPRIEVFCLHCQRVFSLEALRFFEVHHYQVTALAQEVAEEGRLPLRAVEEVFDRLNLVKWNIFQFVVDWERQKFARYHHPFSLLSIFWDAQEVRHLTEKFGVTTLRSYFEEVIGFFRENLRSVDIGARYELGKYFFLLPETPREKAEIVKDRLEKSIQRIKADFPAPKLEIGLYACPGELEEKDLTTLLRELS